MYDPGQIKGFALKVAISGPHLTLIFMNVMQLLERIYHMAEYQGPCAQMERFFFVIFGR